MWFVYSNVLHFKCVGFFKNRLSLIRYIYTRRNRWELCQCVICRVCDTSSVNKISHSNVAVTVLILGTQKKNNFFICHIHNYTEYYQQWNLCSAFNQSKCTHTWSSGQPTLRRPGNSRGFGALLKGLTSVVDNSCLSRDSNPQPLVTSLTLYPLGHNCPLWIERLPTQHTTMDFSPASEQFL